MNFKTILAILSFALVPNVTFACGTSLLIGFGQLPPFSTKEWAVYTVLLVLAFCLLILMHSIYKIITNLISKNPISRYVIRFVLALLPLATIYILVVLSRSTLCIDYDEVRDGTITIPRMKSDGSISR